MMRCDACAVGIEGFWSRCPLCDAEIPATGGAVPSPLPDVPLKFSRRHVLRVLFITSLALILASLAAQLIFSRGLDGIGILRSIWLGVTAMWLVVLMAVRKRRNVAKGTLYLVVIVSLVCLYWDYLTGWHEWSVTYAIPILCTCSIVAVLITVRVMRIEIGEHILYSSVTVLLGLVPIVFLLLGWVTDPIPSVICIVLSLLVLALVQLDASDEMKHELRKRLHL
ncbi:MAG: DUF6320 domain-containing protein [Leucobacter sp.]